MISETDYALVLALHANGAKLFQIAGIFEVQPEDVKQVLVAVQLIGNLAVMAKDVKLPPQLAAIAWLMENKK